MWMSGTTVTDVTRTRIVTEVVVSRLLNVPATCDVYPKYGSA